MLEVKPGVFLGTLSTLVGEKLWNKIQKRQGKGGAIWVKATNNEQRFKLSISGKSKWKISNYDGLQLITRSITKYTNMNKVDRKGEKILSKSIRSKLVKETKQTKITWDTKNTPNNIITRKAFFKHEKCQFSSQYMGTSAYEEFTSESLWEKPWIDDLEVITKSLLSH
ncbi:MAG: type I-E CRISPR-associated endoribonuclease Cas2, partial [Candidatus Thorarchaeota archaeon]